MDRDLSVLHSAWFLLVVIFAGCDDKTAPEALFPRLEEAEVHLADGRFVRAEEEARRLLPEIERAFGEDSSRAADTLDVLVRSLETLPASHPDIGDSYASIGGVRMMTRDYAGARTHYRLALEQLEQREIAPNDKIAHTLHNLGLLLVESGDLSEVLAAHRRGLGSGDAEELSCPKVGFVNARNAIGS
jgi:hypothetical protein